MTRLRRGAGFIVALVGGLLAFTAPAAPAQTVLPARLDAYLTKVLKLTAAERKLLLSGAPIAKNLEADPTKEVAISGAIWISVPASMYVARLQDIENFEKGGGFRSTKKLSEPARVEDFAALTLSPDEVADLRWCEVGDCELKLTAEAVARLKKEINWTRPDVKAQLERLMRSMVTDYVNAYRAGGNSMLAVYRDAAHPTFAAKELRGLVDSMPELSQHLPDMRHYLLEYPNPPTRPTISFMYWKG